MFTNNGPAIHYIIPEHTDEKQLRLWCRDNLQPGWYITHRVGKRFCSMNDAVDFDLITLVWGKANEA